MKKIVLTLILGLLVFPTFVLAAGSASGSAPSSVTNGGSATFTVKLSNTAAWNIKMSGTGATNGCSGAFADVTADGNNTTKTLTITCKATSLGTINFSATGDITSSDGTNSNVSITKTVTVTKPREKESEARLSALSISNYNVNFNKDNYEYNISVEPTVSSINIDATAISNYASVIGTGKKEISEDGNTFEIVVTSETGNQKIYKINVSIVDNNPINVDIDGVKYTVIKTSKLLKKPTNTVESTTVINDFTVPSFINEKSNLTIVGVKDIDGNIKYAIYDKGNYQLYNENVSSVLLYIKEGNLKGYDETTVTINDAEYKGYTYNDRFVIVYAMNLENGEYNYYKYDTIDNNFQVFEIEEKDINKPKQNNLFIITTIIFATLFIGLGLYIIISNVKATKKIKKELKKKD